jgi:uncharacterized membrane protein
METKRRSIAKAVTWRAVATAIGFVTAYYFTGTVSESLAIALTIAALNIVAYYFHERAWNWVRWGKT